MNLFGINKDERRHKKRKVFKFMYEENTKKCKIQFIFFDFIEAVWFFEFEILFVA